ncbi:MAG: shikimate dehydrogenase [Ectothiorhodospiraceae bacterium]|nr:shikimate dehydrogenase [Ectothiorhodospiraceae bacterium]
MTDRYAVFGNPVSHSQSPWIHACFAQQTGQQMEYGRQEVPLDGFARAVQSFFAHGGKGLNVTVPFKEQAWELCQRRSPRAEAAGAVNTLLEDAGALLYGDNTDGIGLVRDLRDNLDLDPAGRHVLILGAGGAVRGVLLPLLETGPASITIANRTVSKARALVETRTGPLRASGYPELAGERFDLVINGTSTGLHGAMPELPKGILAPGAAAYDMVYGAEPTRFMVWSRAQGAGTVSDGLGMLVEQAAESFRIWRGIHPETSAVIRALRARLQAPTGDP